MSDIPTANQARILSTNRRALSTESELMRVRTRISQALERGAFSIEVKPRLSDDARRRLETLGYTVKTFTPPQWEQGEAFDTVTW